jgi:hypothetical protein
VDLYWTKQIHQFLTCEYLAQIGIIGLNHGIHQPALPFDDGCDFFFQRAFGHKLEKTDKSHIFDKPDKSESNECLVRAILDAEIKMGATLPENILQEIWDSYPNEATILLAQAPRKKDVVELLRQHGAHE